MKTVEIIKLLDKDENKYGGATGKERELYLSINGDFVGSIECAILDGWGDGLVTDVTLDVQVSESNYHDRKIRDKAIDDFISKLDYECGYDDESNDDLCVYEITRVKLLSMVEQLKAGGENV